MSSGISAFEDSTVVITFKMSSDANLHKAFEEAYEYINGAPNIGTVQFDFSDYTIKIERKTK